MQKKNIRGFINCNFILVLVSVMLFSCKTTQKNIINNTEQYFTISFYSPGSGIDKDAKGMVDNTIQTYTKKGYTITYSAVPWGREGEVDYCFALQKLKPEVYKEFVNELSTLLKDKMVHINEKSPCRNN